MKDSLLSRKERLDHDLWPLIDQAVNLCSEKSGWYLSFDRPFRESANSLASLRLSYFSYSSPFFFSS